MNETYQHPGKWHEYHIKSTAVRTDNTHYIMSYVIKNLEHNAVYEAIVQARNKYGWNEVRSKIVLSNTIVLIEIVKSYWKNCNPNS